jgi:hypothetical protein
MATFYRKRWFFIRLITVFLIFLVAFPVSTALISTPQVRASDWAGWDAINTIYYNPAQEDAYNPYLATAAGELETYLEQMSGKPWNIVTGAPPASPAIYLSVDAAAPSLAGMGEEAFHLASDANGIRITGHTALAVRHGAYDVLDRLGVRWFFKNTAWTIVPQGLADLGALNAIEEPDFFWRGIRLYPYEGQAETQAWQRHNRNGGAAYYYSGHSYEYILNEAGYIHDETTYNAHPAWFLPTGGYDSWPWQLNPANADVIQMAKDFADACLSIEPETPQWCYGDKLPVGMVSITPNDGGGWNPPYDDNQDITDLVFGLSNAVAASISLAYPGKYIATPSYAAYSNIPSIALEPNILVHVATDYNYSDYTIPQRLAGIAAQGAVPGIRDYVDIWQWNYDAPGTDLQVLQRIPMWGALGAKSYEGEMGENWGGQGHIFYALSKLLWDSSLDLDAILADFYTKAFGPAAATMQSFYENRGTDNATLAESFRLLKQAEIEATGDNAIQARIRQLECYTYFVWKFNNIGITNLSNADLEDFYTFLTKIRDWYLVTYTKDQANIATELGNRGYSAGQITALQDFDTPTDGEVAAWMAEAMVEWGEYEYVPSTIVNPLDLNLVALDDNSTEQTAPTTWNLSILVPSDGNETVTVNVKGESGTVLWCDASGMCIDYYQWTNPIEDWYSVNFQAYMAGTYVVAVPITYQGVSSGVQVDVPDRPAAMVASLGATIMPSIAGAIHYTDYATTSGTYTGYFYVPEGTENFTFYYSGYIQYKPSGSLTDPNNNVTNFTYTGEGGGFEGGGDQSLVIDSPTPGLWKLKITIPAYMSYFGFDGIPPLVWHDPEYLAVEATGPAAPPVLNTIGDKIVGTGQLLQFTVSATDTNGDHLTYSASNLPPWATFNPATRTFSGTPDQPGSYTNVHFEVSDGSLTDSENITISVITYQPDVNSDGVVNILDIIDIVQHWGETGANGWITEDVNNDGIINILDISVVGQNWTG